MNDDEHNHKQQDNSICDKHTENATCDEHTENTKRGEHTENAKCNENTDNEKCGEHTENAICDEHTENDTCEEHTENTKLIECTVDKHIVNLDISQIKNAHMSSRNTMPKGYEINGETYVDKDSLSVHDDDTLVYYELYKVEKTGENADAVDIEMDIELLTIPEGVIINSSVFLTEIQWNCLVTLDEHWCRCALCQVNCMRDTSKEHIKTVTHTRNLDLYKPLQEFDTSIIRKIKEYLHCGVCNITVDLIYCEKHRSSTSHIENLINALSTLIINIYPDKCTENINTCGETEKNNTCGATEKNNTFGETEINNTCGETDKNDTCVEIEKNSDDETEKIQSVPLFKNDHSGTAHELNINPDVDIKQMYDNYYVFDHVMGKTLNEEITSKSLKKVGKEFSKIITTDLGYKRITISFNSWHMIFEQEYNTFNCDLCYTMEHNRLIKKHCTSYNHKMKLALCQLIGECNGSLIRQLEDASYHCTDCDVFMHNILEHLKETHVEKDNVNLTNTKGNTNYNDISDIAIEVKYEGNESAVKQVESKTDHGDTENSESAKSIIENIEKTKCDFGEGLNVKRKIKKKKKAKRNTENIVNSKREIEKSESANHNTGNIESVDNKIENSVSKENKIENCANAICDTGNISSVENKIENNESANLNTGNIVSVQSKLESIESTNYHTENSVSEENKIENYANAKYDTENILSIENTIENIESANLNTENIVNVQSKLESIESTNYHTENSVSEENEIENYANEENKMENCANAKCDTENMSTIENKIENCENGNLNTGNSVRVNYNSENSENANFNTANYVSISSNIENSENAFFNTGNSVSVNYNTGNSENANFNSGNNTKSLIENSICAKCITQNSDRVNDTGYASVKSITDNSNPGRSEYENTIKYNNKIGPTTVGIFSGIILSPFGCPLRISLLSFHTIIYQNYNIYCCVVCNIVCGNIEEHIKEFLHVEVINKIPFIKPFYNHLIRSIRDTLHCGICNTLIGADQLFYHILNQPHLFALENAENIPKNDNIPMAIQATKKTNTVFNNNKENINQETHVSGITDQNITNPNVNFIPTNIHNQINVPNQYATQMISQDMNKTVPKNDNIPMAIQATNKTNTVFNNNKEDVNKETHVSSKTNQNITNSNINFIPTNIHNQMYVPNQYATQAISPNKRIEESVTNNSQNRPFYQGQYLQFGQHAQMFSPPIPQRPTIDLPTHHVQSHYIEGFTQNMQVGPMCNPINSQIHPNLHAHMQVGPNLQFGQNVHPGHYQMIHPMNNLAAPQMSYNIQNGQNMQVGPNIHFRQNMPHWQAGQAGQNQFRPMYSDAPHIPSNLPTNRQNVQILPTFNQTDALNNNMVHGTNNAKLKGTYPPGYFEIKNTITNNEPKAQLTDLKENTVTENLTNCDNSPKLMEPILGLDVNRQSAHFLNLSMSHFQDSNSLKSSHNLNSNAAKANLPENLKVIGTNTNQTIVSTNLTEEVSSNIICENNNSVNNSEPNINSNSIAVNIQQSDPSQNDFALQSEDINKIDESNCNPKEQNFQNLVKTNGEQKDPADFKEMPDDYANDIEREKDSVKSSETDIDIDSQNANKKIVNNKVLKDEEGFVYLNSKKNVFFKVTYLAYHSLVYSENGLRHCFVCSTSVQASNLRRHIESPKHRENVLSNKFIDNTNVWKGKQLMRQIHTVFHCAICNVTMTRKEIKHHLQWSTHTNNYDTSLTTLTRKDMKKMKSVPGYKYRVMPDNEELCTISNPIANVNASYQIVSDSNEDK